MTEMWGALEPTRAVRTMAKEGKDRSEESPLYLEAGIGEEEMERAPSEGSGPWGGPHTEEAKP